MTTGSCGRVVHIPVLAAAVLDGLHIRKGGVYVDGTVGGAGHAALIAEALEGGRLVALDRDPESVEIARERLAAFPGAVVVHRNYGALAEVLRELGIEQVDGVLIDAGFSSIQLDDARRGFSFQMEGPLDMRMDSTCSPDAAQYLAEVREADLAGVLRELGDVGPARRIAKAIVRRRDRGAMRTTTDLAAAVAEALDFVHGVPEETRTVFQAIRMVVNDELRWLECGLRQAIEALRAGGRLVAIAFHSGEDRVVKQVLHEASRPRIQRDELGRTQATSPPLLKILTRKPIGPDRDEIAGNPRAHSARLRVAERLEKGAQHS